MWCALRARLSFLPVHDVEVGTAKELCAHARESRVHARVWEYSSVAFGSVRRGVSCR